MPEREREAFRRALQCSGLENVSASDCNLLFSVFFFIQAQAVETFALLS